MEELCYMVRKIEYLHDIYIEISTYYLGRTLSISCTNRYLSF